MGRLNCAVSVFSEPMSDKLSSGFVILFSRRYDNQTLKIVIQDMEMTAKELRWKVMKVKLEFEVVQNVRPSVSTPNCVSGIQLYCFQLFFNYKNT